MIKIANDKIDLWWIRCIHYIIIIILLGLEKDRFDNVISSSNGQYNIPVQYCTDIEI